MQQATNAAGVYLFAQRRPDWQLPDLDDVHSDLRLSIPLGAEDRAGDRVTCPKCGRSRALYCYDCLLPLVDVPKPQLPLTFSIITHQDERASKNTGVQAHILAPTQVQLHDIDHFPEGFDPARSVVLFPSDDAVEVSQLEPGTVDRAIIIDSKWRKAKELNGHPALSGVRRVKLTRTRSAFWRFHTAGVTDEGVCTLEAMLHFLRAMAVHNKLAQHQLPHTACTAAGAPPGDHPGEATQTATAAAAEPPHASCGQPAGGTSQPADQPTDKVEHVAAEASTTQPSQQQAVGDHLGNCQGRPPSAGADANGAAAAPADAGMTAAEQALFHAWDDLLFFFVQQHRHIQAIAQRRLEQRKARKEQGEEPPSKKAKKNGTPLAQQAPNGQPTDEP